MDAQTSKSAREVIGLFLLERAKELNKTAYRIAMESGLIQNQVSDVFSGSKNYTVDTLFKVLISLDLYVFFGEKNKADENFSEHDLLLSLRKNNPQI